MLTAWQRCSATNFCSHAHCTTDPVTTSVSIVKDCTNKSCVYTAK